MPAREEDTLEDRGGGAAREVLWGDSKKQGVIMGEVYLPISGISGEVVQIERRHEGPKVLVILFGFMGASFRQMARYNRLYAELHNGCQSVTLLTVIPPIQFTMTALVAQEPSENGYGALSSDLCSLVSRQYSTYKLIMHVMSQNGTFAYQTACKERVLMDRLSCVIFDSAPVSMTKEAIFTAASAAIGKGMAKRAISLLEYIVSEKTNFESYLVSRTEDVKSFFISQDPSESALFLYSKADKITDYRYVEEILAVRTGSKASGVDFGESGHTGHILRFPRKYREAVLRHCCRALGLGEGEAVLESDRIMSKL